MKKTSILYFVVIFAVILPILVVLFDRYEEKLITLEKNKSKR